MTEKTFEIIAASLAIPTLVSFVVGMGNYLIIKLKFLRDNEIKKEDRIPYFLVGGELEYVRDMTQGDKSGHYQLNIKIAKYCGIVFVSGFLSLIALGITSVFLDP